MNVLPWIFKCPHALELVSKFWYSVPFRHTWYTHYRIKQADMIPTATGAKTLGWNVFHFPPESIVFQILADGRFQNPDTAKVDLTSPWEGDLLCDKGESELLWWKYITDSELWYWKYLNSSLTASMNNIDLLFYIVYRYHIYT